MIDDDDDEIIILGLGVVVVVLWSVVCGVGGVVVSCRVVRASLRRRLSSVIIVRTLMFHYINV